MQQRNSALRKGEEGLSLNRRTEFFLYSEKLYGSDTKESEGAASQNFGRQRREL